MKQNYLLYGLGAVALLFVLKGKKQEPAPEEEAPAAPKKQGAKKKKATTTTTSPLDNFTAGNRGEEIITEIKEFQFPAAGQAPRVTFSTVDENGKKVSDLDLLYDELADEVEAVSDPAMLVDLYGYLGQKKNKTPREKILFEAVSMLIRE